MITEKDIELNSEMAHIYCVKDRDLTDEQLTQIENIWDKKGIKKLKYANTDELGYLTFDFYTPIWYEEKELYKRQIAEILNTVMKS